MRTFFLSLAAVAGFGYFAAPALLHSSTIARSALTLRQAQGHPERSRGVSAVEGQEKGGDDRTGPYDVVANWPQPLAFAKPGYIWGSTGGIFAESPNRIFIANRGELKLPATLPPGFTGFWG